MFGALSLFYFYLFLDFKKMTKRPKEAKYNDIVGWCPETTTTNLLKMMQHDKKGDWRRDSDLCPLCNMFNYMDNLQR